MCMILCLQVVSNNQGSSSLEKLVEWKAHDLEVWCVAFSSHEVSLMPGQEWCAEQQNRDLLPSACFAASLRIPQGSSRLKDAASVG